jgi:16S rRNA (guanine527-N7)-methyltransferase
MAEPSRALPTEEVISRVFADFGVTVGALQIGQIRTYLKLLLTWNEKLNLTGIRDPLEILYRHFGESMFAASVVPLREGRLADVGTGGGFPGMALKIISPSLHVLLVEANARKAVFLAEVIRELQLSDTTVLVSRYEELGEELAPLDYVVVRALGHFEGFLRWAGSASVRAKHVVLWIGGRDLDPVRTLGGWEWQDPVAIPRSLQRFLLVGLRNQLE